MQTENPEMDHIYISRLFYPQHVADQSTEKLHNVRIMNVITCNIFIYILLFS